MKNIFLFILLLSSLSVDAQTSYEFASPLPPGMSEVNKPASRHHGFYKSFLTDRVIEVNDKGIFAHNGIVSTLSRSTVRESSQYIIRNQHIFGIVEGDSLPFYSDSLNYYFIIPTTEAIISEDASNKLVKISSSSYVINFEENGKYTPCMLTFMNDEMRMQYFDYDFGTTAFDKMTVASQNELDGLTTLTLNPSLEEFMQVDLKQIFGKEMVYKRQELADL